MDDMEDVFKTLGVGLLIFVAFIGCLIVGLKVFGPDRPERPPIEPSSSARLIDVGNASFNLHVVTVDGVDYVVSTTYRGVGICPKVTKTD